VEVINLLKEIRKNLQDTLKKFDKVSRALQAKALDPALVELSYAVYDVQRAIDIIEDILAAYFGELP